MYQTDGYQRNRFFLGGQANRFCGFGSSIKPVDVSGDVQQRLEVAEQQPLRLRRGRQGDETRRLTHSSFLAIGAWRVTLSVSLVLRRVLSHHQEHVQTRLAGRPPVLEFGGACFILVAVEGCQCVTTTTRVLLTHQFHVFVSLLAI